MISYSTPAPIRSRLLTLTFITILPILIFTTVIVIYLQSRQINIAKRGFQNTVTALAVGVDEKVNDLKTLLRILSLELSQDPGLVKKKFKRFLTGENHLLALEIIDEEGRILVASGPSTTDYNSEKTVSITTEIPGKNLSKQFIRATFDTMVFSDFLMAQSLEKGWTAAILNENGTIIARSRDPDIYVGRQATPKLREKSQKERSAFFEDQNQEGVLSFGSFVRTSTLPWTVVIGAPRAAFFQEIDRTRLFITFGTLLFLTLALGLAQLTARKISSPLQHLAQLAASFEQEDLRSLDTGLREVNEVSEALVTSHRKIRENEEHFKLMVNSMPQIAWLSEPKTGRLIFNEAWTNYSGLDEDRARAWANIHPEDVESSQKIIMEAYRDSKPFQLEHRILRKSDGVYRWHLVRSVPLRSTKGEVQRWVGTATDIDDQKRSALALKVLAEASRIFSSSLSVEEILSSVAEVFVPKLGDWCSIDLITASGIRKVALVHPDEKMKEKVTEFLKLYPTDPDAPTGAPNVIRTGKEEVYLNISDDVLRMTAKDERHFELLKAFGFRSAIVIPISTRKRTLGAITLIYSGEGKKYRPEDVSYLKELGYRAGAAIENALLFQEVREAVEMRDEFLSIASHELKTPITTLRLQTQLALKSLETTGNMEVRLKNSLEMSLRQTSRLVTLVDELLDVSRITAGKLEFNFERANLRELIVDVCERFPQSPLTLELEDVEFICDRPRLDQVITNVLSNAVKYGRGNPISVHLKKLQHEVRISVKDQGIGIPPENLAKIFDRFERAVDYKKFSGLGLGLYISQSIVEGHGGRFEVESCPNEGSTFTIIIPERELESVKV